MIGQNQIISDIDRYIGANGFPNLCMIEGPKGSGKATLCEYLRDKYNHQWIIYQDNSVASVRSAIEQAYKNTEPTGYIFLNVDNMSANAKNALLKVTEEPPNKSHFIMTIQDRQNILETIRSRSVIFTMDIYTEQELKEYTEGYLTHRLGENEWNILRSICEVPGDINMFGGSDKEVYDFDEFVQKVVDNIAEVSGSNVFKIADRLKLKDDGEGYDIALFFRAFIRTCVDRYSKTQDDIYMKAIRVTDRYAQDLRITGISKQGVVDLWILDIRKVWL